MEDLTKEQIEELKKCEWIVCDPGKNNGQYSDDYDPTKSYPTNLLSIESKQLECNSINRTHPTQKPVNLFRYLIKTYSNEGDTVYDGYSGSGTTAVACVKEKRNFICSENNQEYFNLSPHLLHYLH